MNVVTHSDLLCQILHEVNALFGTAMGDYFEGFLLEEARQMGKTIDEIKAWKPQSRTGKQSHAKTQRKRCKA